MEDYRQGAHLRPSDFGEKRLERGPMSKTILRNGRSFTVSDEVLETVDEKDLARLMDYVSVDHSRPAPAYVGLALPPPRWSSDDIARLRDCARGIARRAEALVEVEPHQAVAARAVCDSLIEQVKLLKSMLLISSAPPDD